MKTIKPMQHQTEAIDQIVDAFHKGHKRVLYTLDTGGGKTVVCSLVAQLMQGIKRPLLFLAHRNSLVDQASETFTSLGIPHGVIKAGSPISRHLINVGMVQTVARRNIDRQALVVIDEAHHCAGQNQWRTVAEKFADRVLGVTATPIRADGLGLGVKSGGIFEHLIQGADIDHLLKIKRLVPLKLYAPKQRIDWKNFTTKGDDFDQDSVSADFETRKIYGDAVKVWEQIAKGMRTITFCHCIKAAEAVAQAFCDAGYPSAVITGNDTRDMQKAKIRSLAERQIINLVSVDVISEGTDIPAVECGLMMRPTMSFGLYRQQAGRIMRWAQDKTHGILIDMVGNCAAHGDPMSKIIWELDGNETLNVKKSNIEKGIVKLKQCPECWMYRKMNPCEHCGAATDGSRKIDQVFETEYMEIEAKKREAIQRKVEGKEIIMLRKFLQMAKSQGYKPFWGLKRFEYTFKRMPTKDELAAVREQN